MLTNQNCLGQPKHCLEELILDAMNSLTFSLLLQQEYVEIIFLNRSFFKTGLFSLSPEKMDLRRWRN